MEPLKTKKELMSAINEVKQFREGYVTNFYHDSKKCDMYIGEGLLHVAGFDKCCFVFRKDLTFFHLHYFSTSLASLAESLKMLTAAYDNAVFVSDIVGDIQSVNEAAGSFAQAGFERYATLHRMSATGSLHEPYKNCDAIKYADCSHVGMIISLLVDSFDAYSNQLPLISEVNEWVSSNKVLVMLEMDTLKGVLVFEQSGATSLLRYLIVHQAHRGKKIGQSLLERFLLESSGAKRVLLWVDVTNKAALALYEKYGFRQDQMIDQIMIWGLGHEA